VSIASWTEAVKQTKRRREVIWFSWNERHTRNIGYMNLHTMKVVVYNAKRVSYLRFRHPMLGSKKRANK
jgi:hypothetical protein